MDLACVKRRREGKERKEEGRFRLPWLWARVSETE